MFKSIPEAPKKRKEQIEFFEIRGKSAKFSKRISIFGKQRTISLHTDEITIAVRRYNRFVQLYKHLCNERELGVNELSDDLIYQHLIADLLGKELPKVIGQKLHIDDLIRHYKDYDEQLPVSKRIKESSLKSYEYRIRAIAKGAGVEYFHEFDGMKLTEITRSINPKAKDATIASNFRVMSAFTTKGFLAYLSDREIVIENPFRNEASPKVKIKPFKPLCMDLQREIWEDSENLAVAQTMIVKMALGMGLRRSEIEHAQVSWFTKTKTIDGKGAEKKEITIYECCVQPVTLANGKQWTPKSKIEREIPIDEEFYNYLCDLRKKAHGYTEECEWMIPSDQGGVPESRLYADMVSVLKWLAEKGVKTDDDPKLIHKLRKQFGSAIVRTSDIYTASKLLGHSSVTVTERHYAGLIDNKPVQIF